MTKTISGDLQERPEVSAVSDMANIEVRELEPAEQGEWDRFVTLSPSGTFFHLYEWQMVVRAALGHRAFMLVARGPEGIRGVFPICRVRNRIFGDCLVSMPLAVYGGICANDADAYFSLLRAGEDLGRRMGVKYVEMRNKTEPFPSDLPGRDLYVTFSQDLSPGPEKLLQRLPRDTRYAVRKSQKAGLDWVEDLSVNEFYELYAKSVHRQGTPVFSKKLFISLLSAFPKECRIFGVRKSQQAIAGVFCFYFKDQVLPYYGGALPEFFKDSPNNFMYWNLIAQSCAEGRRRFDFGRSKRGTGAYSFKSAWSMEVAELPYRYQLIRATEIPHLSPVDQTFRLPVSLWKRMPYSWTKVIGPRLIRHVPSV
jgi:FemAB-related protein (PEP-CTERM system-associated)